MNELFALLQSDPSAAIAFGALASAVVAFCALIISTISVWVSIWAIRAQKKHNELSIRPLAEITVADYEDSLRVKLRNNGTGPMIISDVEVSDGKKKEASLIEWMPRLPAERSWTAFSHALRDRTLQPGSEIVLLELTESVGERNFATCREATRNALAPLTVTVSYTDIYNKPMSARIKKLSWFGRRK